MTEDEAKTKICPMTLARESGDEHWNCIASGCMAWKFDRAEYEDGEPLPIGVVPADPGWEKNGETWYCGPGVTGEKRQRWRKPNPRTGHCTMMPSAQRGEVS